MKYKMKLWDVHEYLKPSNLESLKLKMKRAPLKGDKWTIKNKATVGGITMREYVYTERPMEVGKNQDLQVFDDRKILKTQVPPSKNKQSVSTPENEKRKITPPRIKSPT